MKKVFAFVLAALLVVGLAVPAAAELVLSTSISDELPALANENGNVKLYNRDDILKAPKDIQNAMVESDKELDNAGNAGQSLAYFYYVEILSGESSVILEFAPIPHQGIQFMQYIDSMWVQLEHSVADNGVITVVDIVDAPLAIFTGSKRSPSGNMANLVPILVDESYLSVQVHTLEEVSVLPEAVQARIAEAKDRLEEACPEDHVVKYFFEMELVGTDRAVTVEFEPIAHDSIVFKQFVDGAWVELKHDVQDSDIIKVSGLVNGPVAIFTK